MKIWQKRKLKKPLKKAAAANVVSKTFFWTKHAEEKMRFYRLSKQRVRRVLNSPKRIEEGIAPNTLAMMQPASVRTAAGKPAWSQEIWVMIQKKRQDTIKIISAWRYPGRTKPKDEITFNIIQQEYANYLAGDNFKD
jgi:hypothetical protein